MSFIETVFKIRYKFRNCMNHQAFCAI